ncbi:MAG: hypothetical protein UT33_C0015G0019 [Candidatus Peregrinibacteria bacterium GW2011_GWC2_39_14]|nr:MAG: hypothetical protein US92_C0007G0019 [Candidatus Peregrinibacteria bacterium GW2011_GWA2_38_36]KKR04962.1 MAG: hypothetical protein UT33_C0015G0019 [Candidatus Peregrinibacteria bacterium GW2011_GWC2_39_14]
MKSNFETILSNLEQIDPPQNLYKNIFMKIARAQKRSALIKFILFGVVAIASLIEMIPVFQSVAQRFYQSGFYHYSSLIFSDFEIVLANWKEFGLSLLESLPVAEIAIFLAVFLVLLLSLKFVAENIKNAFLSVRLNNHKI